MVTLLVRLGVRRPPPAGWRIPGSDRAPSGTIPVSWGPLLGLRVRGFGQQLDHVESAIPFLGDVGHRPGRVIEAPGLDAVPDLAPNLVAPEQSGPFEDDEMLGHGLSGEGDLAGQRARRLLSVADQKVQEPA